MALLMWCGNGILFSIIKIENTSKISFHKSSITVEKDSCLLHSLLESVNL